MRREAMNGYSLVATTNGARLMAGVVLRLARQAQRQHPDGKPLFINQRDYFRAYLRVTGLPADAAPDFVRLANEYEQHQLIEYRRDQVLDTARTRDLPRMALNVKTWWPQTPARPDRYTFHDTLSQPALLVINNRTIRYRMLDYGDMIVFDQVDGLQGRPTSGVLGLLFKVIGAGHVVWSRYSVTPEGGQIVYGKAQKSFMKQRAMVTIYPDGTAIKDLPPERPDLQALAHRLKEPLRIHYKKFSL